MSNAVRHAVVERDRANVVAVVERDRAALLHREHRLDVRDDRRVGAATYSFGSLARSACASSSDSPRGT